MITFPKKLGRLFSILTTNLTRTLDSLQCLTLELPLLQPTTLPGKPGVAIKASTLLPLDRILYLLNKSSYLFCEANSVLSFTLCFFLNFPKQKFFFPLGVHRFPSVLTATNGVAVSYTSPPAWNLTLHQ